MHDPDDELLDRRGISDFSAQLFGEGGRIRKRRIDKLALIGQGPPVDAVLGRRHLTSRRNAEPWVRAQYLSLDEAATKPSMTSLLVAKQEQRRAERDRAAS
jgi:hypothetical protein